jgi:hypothetical protein
MQDTVSAETSAFLSTSPVIQQSFLPQGERTPTGNTKKRLRFIVDDAACEGSDDKLSGDEDSDMTPSMGGILLRSVSRTCFDCKAVTDRLNQDPGTSKRRCRGKANNTTCISEVMAFTSTPDDDTVDLQIADGSSIKVSKAIMRQVRSFNTFFSTDQEQSAYSLSGDDSFAFKVLLAVLHHKLYLLPLRMTFSQLYELATVCDKYDTTEIVSPHVESREWINALWKDSKPCLGSWASWLWICHAFQTGKEKGDKFYGRVLDVLAANMRLRDDKWYFERDNSYVEISIMKCPSKLDPLQGTYGTIYRRILLTKP